MEPVTRKQALNIADKILSDAERERLEVAEREAERNQSNEDCDVEFLREGSWKRYNELVAEGKIRPTEVSDDPRPTRSL